MAQPFVLAAFIENQVALQTATASDPILVEATNDALGALSPALPARASWYVVLPARASSARVEDVTALAVRKEDALGTVRLQLPRDYFSSDTRTRFVGHLSRLHGRRLAYAGQVAVASVDTLTTLVAEQNGHFMYGIHPGFALAALLGDTGTSVAFGIGASEIIGVYHDSTHTIINAVEASSPARATDFALEFIAMARKEARPEATTHALVFADEIDDGFRAALDKRGVGVEIARDTDDQPRLYAHWLLAGLRVCVERRATLPALWVLPTGETPTLRDYAPLGAGALVGLLVFLGYLLAYNATNGTLANERAQYALARAQTARLSADLGSHVARTNGIAATLAAYRNSGPRYASAIMALGNAAVANDSWASSISFNGSSPSITFNSPSLQGLSHYQASLARLGYTLPWSNLTLGTLPHSVTTTIGAPAATATPPPGGAQ